MIGSVITVLSDFNAQHMHMLQSDVCRLSVCHTLVRYENGWTRHAATNAGWFSHTRVGKLWF